MKAQAASIAVVVACGVAVLIGSEATTSTLRTSQSEYYERYHFAQVFARLKRAPEAVASQLREIPGVGLVVTRVVQEVAVDLPDLVEPATLRLVSIPLEGQPPLNRLHLRSGRWPDPGRLDEMLVNEAFVRANRLQPGDRISAVVNSRRQSLRIAGVALSPEYIYQLQEGAVFPDDRRFGVAWVPRDGLAAAFDLRGAFNDVAVSLVPGTRAETVVPQMNAVLDRYGCLGAFGRDRQTSHRLVADELSQLAVMSSILPAIFLAVSAFLLHVVLSRLVATEREQIAALKAVGYGNASIGLHYMKLVTAVVLVGVLVGIALGGWFGHLLTRQYSNYFHFPLLLFRLDPGLAVFAGGSSLAAALMGALGSVRHATSLPPAEAMRPPSPAVFRRGFFDRIGLDRIVSEMGSLVLRNLERRPVRAALSSLAIALSASIVVVTLCMFDGVRFLTERALPDSRREDVSVNLFAPLAEAPARAAFGHLPGVERAEGLRQAPVRLRAGHRNREVALVGLRSRDDFRRVLDVQLRPVDPVEEGLMLSSALAKRLEVREGERVQVELLQGDRRIRDVPVYRVVDEPLGYGAYMEAAALARFLGESGAIDSALLRVDRQQAEALFTKFKELPSTSGATRTEIVTRNFRQLVKQSLLVNLIFLGSFAGAIAAAIVYNDARIALSERAHELATLRVIGFTRGEIARILFGELTVVMVLGLPLGSVLGWVLALLIVPLFGNEMMRLPVVPSPATFAIAGAMVIVAGLLSASFVRRRLNRLDLIAVLKTRE
jgi:putative ABC transport system permease protein